MAYEVKIEKIINRSPSEVFRALGEGKLFMNCSADSSTLKVDFRVGGKYRIDFKNHGVYNMGEFLDIVPNKKVVFSWCQTFGADQKPDTQVTIELFPEGTKTRMTLLHTGFKDKATCDDHYQGWNGGMTDMADELEHGNLRMLRHFAAPVETLFKTMETEFLEVANQKIPLSTFVDNQGPVRLNLKTKPNGSSTLEILHKGLSTPEAQLAYRRGWETVTERMAETLGRRT